MGWFQCEWDVAVFRNRLRIADRQSGKVVERKATHSFSTETMLIANRECLEEEFRQAVMELAPGRRWFLYPKVYITQVETQLQPMERDALEGAFLDAGSSKVVFADG